VTQTPLEALTEHLITLLRKRPGQYVTLDKLSAQLKTERGELERALKQAAVWEYKLRRHAVKGVKFVAAPDLLTATETRHG
jgi:hypothetical protein